MKTKLKKVFNNKIFMFIFGGLLFSAVSVYAITYFPSNQVTYDNSSSKLNSTDVQGAIDELYNTCSSSIKSGDNIYYVYHKESPGGSTTTKTAYLVRTDLNGQNRKTLIEISKGTYYPIMDSIYVTNNYIYYSYHKKSEGSTSTQSAWLIRTDLNGQNQQTLLTYKLGNGYPAISDIYVTNNYIYYSYNRESASGSTSTTTAALIRADLNGQNQQTLLTYQLGSGIPAIDSIFIK